MNDLIRPARTKVSTASGPSRPRNAFAPEDYETEIPGTEPWDVVGPICESGDFLAKDRPAQLTAATSRSVFCRRLWDGDGLELQHPAASSRDSC